MLFTSQTSPHITLGNEQCLKLLLRVCNTKKRGELSFSLGPTNTFNQYDKVTTHTALPTARIDGNFSKLNLNSYKTKFAWFSYIFP
jgi:hypothetical protein